MCAMASHPSSSIGFFKLFGCFIWFTVALTDTYGRVFILQPGDIVEAHDKVMVQGACQGHGGHLASAAELQRAVAECSFTICARGWLADSRIGTMECGERDTQGWKTLSMTVEKISAPIPNLGIFCVRDREKPCGGPPTFPHATLQTGGDLALVGELVYQCHLGYSLPNGRSAFSLLCNFCGEWYGQVWPCQTESRGPPDDYEHQFLREGNLAFSDREKLEEDHKGLGYSQQGTLDQEREGLGLNGGKVQGEKMEGLTVKEAQVFTMSAESTRSWIHSLAVRRIGQGQQKSGSVHTDSRLWVKASGSDAENAKTINSSENVTITTPRQCEETLIRRLVASADETVKLGYPGHQETEEERDKTGGSTTEDSEEQAQEWNMMNDMSQLSRDPVFMDLSQVAEWSRNTGEGEAVTPNGAVLPHEWMKLPSRFSKKGLETTPIPTSLGLDDVTLSFQDPHERATVPFVVTRFYEGYTDRNWTQPNTETKPQPTKEACRGQGCGTDNWGHLILTVIVPITALLVVVVTAFWYYKTQKSSAHPVSGESRNKILQHIEMQQKV